jgi:hypothetical protein
MKIEIINKDNIIFWSIPSKEYHYNDEVSISEGISLHIKKYGSEWEEPVISTAGIYTLGEIAGYNSDKKAQRNNEIIKCNLYAIRDNVVFREFIMFDNDNIKAMGKYPLKAGGKVVYEDKRYCAEFELHVKISFAFTIANDRKFYENTCKGKDSISIEDIFDAKSSFRQKIWQITEKQTRQYLNDSKDGFIDRDMEAIAEHIKYECEYFFNEYGIKIIIHNMECTDTPANRILVRDPINEIRMEINLEKLDSIKEDIRNRRS